MSDKKIKFRVVKLTRKSGINVWAIQKMFKNWLTGKEFWKFYANDWTSVIWTRFIDDAEFFFSEESATNEMYKIIDCHNRKSSMPRWSRRWKHETGRHAGHPGCPWP